MLTIIIKIAPSGKEMQKQQQKKPTQKSPKHITEATETLFLKLRELIPNSFNPQHTNVL